MNRLKYQTGYNTHTSQAAVATLLRPAILGLRIVLVLLSITMLLMGAYFVFDP